MEVYTETDIRRFYSFVTIGEPDECWEWIGSTAVGYGLFSFDGHQITASRFAFWIATGHHPGKLLVCHSCDNGLCVNPKHLWLGTAKDNSQDASRKGHMGRGIGNSKLTESEVHEIRVIQSTGIKRSQLAEEYDVNQVTIDNIINRRSWKHV